MTVDFLKTEINYSKEFFVQQLLAMGIYKVDDKQLYELSVHQLSQEYTKRTQ